MDLIVGLGKTGLSCARFLGRQGKPFAVNDSRLDPPGLTELKQEFPQCELVLGKFSEPLFAKATQLIVSPGVWVQEPLIAQASARGIPVIGDIELFAQQARAPIVAITGSNGKSTVTTLVGEMAKAAGLKVQVGGNLGTPALDLLAALDCDLYVVELSSFQLETTYSLKAAAATVLNISPDHMDRYADLNAYAQAKLRIYNQSQTAIINKEDHFTYLPANNPAKQSFFSLQTPSQAQEYGIIKEDNKYYLAKGQQKLLAVHEMRMKGTHNWANALAALALGEAVHLPLPAMLETLKNFAGLAHRCQWVAEHNHIAWYNDSKGTNVGATSAAITGLGGALHGGKIILLAGGLGKDADFTSLQPQVREHVRAVIVFGKDGPIIGEALAPVTKIIPAKDLAEAIVLALPQAQPGDAVLLSPACASYDMFNNFEHRGVVFMELVQNLMQQLTKGKS